MFLLDTDILIYILAGRAPTALAHLHRLNPTEVGTTAISIAELRYGALHSQRKDDNNQGIDALVNPLVKMPFDVRAAEHFARIKQFLTVRGTIIGVMDMMIAATALANDAILVTNNIREFSRVPDLRVENWAEAAT